MCEREGVEVPRHEIARGWKAPDGRTVILSDDDMDHVPLPIRKTAEVLGFVPDDDVDPIMYSTPYCAAPDGPAAQRPYALLVEALARHGTVAVCKVPLRSRERLAVLRGRGAASSSATRCAGPKRSAIPATWPAAHPSPIGS